MTSSTDYNAIAAVAGGSNNNIGEANYEVAMDIDRDGDVDWTDASIVSNAGTRVGLPTGWISSPTTGGGDNPLGYCGYLFNRPTKLYTVRFRVYDPALGRWLTRDPIGYADSMGLYGYGPGSPAAGLDPYGLEAQKSVFWAGVGGFFQGAWEGTVMAADNLTLGIVPGLGSYADTIRQQNAGNGWYTAGDWSSFGGSTILHVLLLRGMGKNGWLFGKGGLTNSNNWIRLGWSWYGWRAGFSPARQVLRLVIGNKRLSIFGIKVHWHALRFWPRPDWKVIGGAIGVILYWLWPDDESGGTGRAAPGRNLIGNRGKLSAPYAPLPAQSPGFGGHTGHGNNSSGQSSSGGPQAGIGSDCP